MPWHCKPTGIYARTSTEAYDNALMAYNILSSRGWSLLAFCGMWGNVEAESFYNPWRWQGDNVLATTDTYYIEHQTYHAYGLVQWDPASKYLYNGSNYSGYAPNYSDRPGGINDGTAQMNYLDDTAVSSGQYFPNPNYPAYMISYDNYKQMTVDNYSYQFAARAWFHNYERGTWSDNRVYACQYWYETLEGVPPTPARNIPIWLLFKIRERNET